MKEEPSPSMKTLLVGWFSFHQMGATAGDLIARDVMATWLDEAGEPFDTAVAAPFTGGVDWRSADPADYSHVVFVCGPFGNGPPITEFLDRFDSCRLIGVDLSMLEPLDEWNPFDLLIERDSSEDAHPDITFLARTSSVPLVGVVKVHPQSEYGDRALHARANEAIDNWLGRRHVTRIPIDTRLDSNATLFRSPEEVESAIARMDVVVTTRLHGLVLAVKNGVPALAIDPIAGGAKIARQAQTIGWPACLRADSLSEEAFHDALDFCLSNDGRLAARACADRAVDIVGGMRERFIAYVERGS